MTKNKNKDKGSTKGDIKEQILKLNEWGGWGLKDFSLSAHDVFVILDKARAKRNAITEKWKDRGKEDFDGIQEAIENDEWFKEQFGDENENEE